VIGERGDLTPIKMPLDGVALCFFGFLTS
jgi:hypothetical protein